MTFSTVYYIVLVFCLAGPITIAEEKVRVCNKITIFSMVVYFVKIEIDEYKHQQHFRVINKQPKRESNHQP